MAQDLRKLFEENRKTEAVKMSEGHDSRFLERLEKELPKRKHPFKFDVLNIAASVIALLGLAYGAFQFFSEMIAPEDKPIEIVNSDVKTMGDFSPDLKKVEDYYLASINLELSKLELTPENKELVDGYMARLKELNDEYASLTAELNENGISEDLLNAHIDNLKFRLNLVIRLKQKIEEFNDASFAQDII